MNSSVLAARELRWNTRMHLVQTFACPLLSLTLRAPSTLRVEPAFLDAFSRLCSRLEDEFASQGLAMSLLHTSLDAEGPARHYGVEDALAVKKLSIKFEEEILGGALLDIDLLDEKARPISRRELGLPPRACMVCGTRPAAVCIKGSIHTNDVTCRAFRDLMQQCLNLEDSAQRIARYAVQSLLFEVSVTPKPGLVDRHSAGAHSDMDYYTFLSSTAALAPYFLTAARLGQDGAISTDSLLPRLRPFGIAAEAQMNKATGGVNTHKGLIFSLGILCIAAGRMREVTSTEELCELAAQIARPALLDDSADSHGQQVMLRHGVSGARGEAAEGFPNVRRALPILESALSKGESVDRAGVKTLLFLMSELHDTNVLYRAGAPGLELVQESAARLLAAGCPEDELNQFCAELRQKGISPGGSADMLALCFFLHLIRQPSSA